MKKVNEISSKEVASVKATNLVVNSAEVNSVVSTVDMGIFNAMSKEQRQNFLKLSKKVKNNLKKSTSTISFWTAVLLSENDNDLKSLLNVRYPNFDVLSNKEKMQTLIRLAKEGYPLKDADGKICVARRIKNDSVSYTYYIHKETFSFVSVYGAIMRTSDVRLKEPVTVSTKEEAQVTFDTLYQSYLDNLSEEEVA